jgi:hypothetical protein
MYQTDVIMNWKLILQLSLFGLAMGLATVFLIPSTIEPAFWLAIWLACAYMIARQCRSLRFVNGLLVGIGNSIWITAAHVGLFSQYAASHTKEVEMMSSMPLSPRVMMVPIGILSGVVSGAIIGLLALLAGKLFIKRTQTTASA